MIATLKKERRKDKAKIQELTEIIHEQNFLLQHNDQYMLELENQLEALAVPPQNLSFLDQHKKKMLRISKANLELSLDPSHRSPSAWKIPPSEVGPLGIKVLSSRSVVVVRNPHAQ
jgi:hypothetical protein